MSSSTTSRHSTSARRREARRCLSKFGCDSINFSQFIVWSRQYSNSRSNRLPLVSRVVLRNVSRYDWNDLRFHPHMLAGGVSESSPTDFVFESRAIHDASRCDSVCVASLTFRGSGAKARAAEPAAHEEDTPSLRQQGWQDQGQRERRQRPSMFFGPGWMEG